MDIELNRQFLLLSEMGEVVHNYIDGKKIDFTKVNREIERLLHSAESCNKMIDNTIKISNKKYYNMLNEFASVIGWNQNDYHQVIKMAYKFKYEGEAVIKTTMKRIVSQNANIESKIMLWIENVGVDLDIIYNRDFRVDFNHFYSVEEIKKLVDEKKIIVICEKERKLTSDIKKYQEEDYHPFDCEYDKYSIEYEFFNENGKFYSKTLQYIRKKINSEKLQKLILNHINNVNNEITDVITDGGFASDSWTNVAQIYSEEFEKKGYSKRLKQINDNNKYL